jgi:hypothetical protein
MPQKNPKLFSVILLLVLGLFLVSFLSKKPASFELVTKLPLNSGAFTTDNIQNTYIYSGSTIKKYDPQGKLLFRYDDKSYGNITYIDVTDPLKIMVFYKDFPEIIFLDNTLSLNGSPISPNDMGFPLTTLACISHDNGAWLYDAQGIQLVRFDLNLTVTEKTGNLVQTIGMNLNPDYMTEYNSYLYLNDSAQGILVFDQFGTYYKTIPIKGLKTFQIRGDDMFYLLGNTVHDFHVKEITEDLTKTPDSAALNIRVEKNMLFEACKDDTLRVYRVK